MRIYDWGARPADRWLTVATLKQARTSGARYTQVTADTAEEARAADAAGIEMVVCRASNVRDVRDGSARVFVTAALGFAERITEEEILRAAFKALTDGADAVITARSLSIVERLASEDIPVMGHLGLVPRKSTWTGSMRAVGKTLEEACELHDRFRLLESAGAFAVEAEIINAPVMRELRARSNLVTVSLGSGPDADVVFLFMSDICGESERVPRHARTYGDIARLRTEIVAERCRALEAYRQDVRAGSYPGPAEQVDADPDMMAALRERLDADARSRCET